MDYEKLHKDTIAKLQEMVNSGKITVETACGICADFVPESKDEMIRKSLAAYFAKFKPDDMWDADFSFGDIVVWFEKQSKKPDTDFSDLRTWKYIVDAVWTEKEGIGQYLDSPFTEEVAKKLQKRFGNAPKEATYTYEVETGNGNIKSLVTEKVQLPKFKVCDWVVHECGEETATLQIARIVGKIYVFSDGTTLSVADEDTLRFWDINKDAKAGDVLYAKGSYYKEYVFVFSSFTEDNVISTHFGYDVFHGTFDKKLTRFGREEDFMSVTPATKEQCDLLFQKMKEAGYEWDSEKKGLRKIKDENYDGEDYGIDSLFHAQRILEKTLGKVDGYQSDDGILEHKCAITAVKKLYEQKPAWSEEDEKNSLDIKCLIGSYRAGDAEYRLDSWIDRLKDRVQPQPKQEWSEEDEGF